MSSFFVVLFEFAFLIRVPQSSSKSFSINTKHTIKTLFVTLWLLRRRFSNFCVCKFSLLVAMATNQI